MAPSSGTYIVEGVKFSVDLLKEISSDLPPPTSLVVGLVQQIIAIVETIQDNHEQCKLLVDHLLQLSLVVLAALKQTPTGSQQPEIPPELKSKIDHFKDTLDRILKEVLKIQKIVDPQRKRDRLMAFVLHKSFKSELKKCHDQLDWAMKEFDVASRLSDALRLCQVSEQVQQVLINQEAGARQVDQVLANQDVEARQTEQVLVKQDLEIRQVEKVITNQYLEKLPIAKYAGFDCERPDRPSTCFEGTREAIIKEIIAWVQNPDQQATRFFWLNGLAGIGKTTVACTVAKLARSLGILGASFIFSRRGEAELRDPARVFPTIAYQLALSNPAFCELITAALQAHPDAPFASLKEQLDRLIIEPLSKLQHDPERIVAIIFDAFDECEPVGANTILQLLVAAIPSLPFFLKILVTSRPEPHIRSVLVPANNKLHIAALHDIEASVVKSDILVYLHASIRNLPKKKGLNLPADWITDEQIQLLADAAGNLFIYAATVLRFLMRALNPRRQLNVLLKIVTSLRKSSDGSTPFFSLDQLYTEILHGLVTPENRAEVLALLQVVLGTIVLLRNPLPVDALERLTGLQEDDAVVTLDSLHSLILPPSPPDNCPRTYHPSFPDFLQDPLRCTDPDLRIETQKHETRLAIHCLELLNAKLHKEMLGNFDPTLLNSEVKDLERKINVAFPPELQYACRFWASHLAQVLNFNDEKLQAAVAEFASRRLLPWLESMSWMGRAREAVDCLEVVNSWVTNSSASSITTSLLNDAYRLLLAHFPMITQSASHIARFALPFAPRSTQLRSTYAEYADVKVILGDPELDWSPCLMTSKSHSAPVTSVVISSDSTRIVSGSTDNNIHIHDASSGGFIMALTGHSDWVSSVAFSPDGSRVASGSGDHTVRLWDATTGHEQSKLEGHTETVFTVAFSPDGGRLVSGSGDQTIRVWDTVAGDVLMTLKGHSDDVLSVCFFPDDSRLVSGSRDKTARIWDLANGTCVTQLEGHSGTVRSVAVSPDGSQIASGSDDKTILIWDALNGASLATLEGHTGGVKSVAFSPSGDRIVSGSGDHSVRLWNATTGDTMATFHGHTGSVWSVAFSPDGRRVVFGSHYATVKIWDAKALAETTSQDGASHSGRVSSLAFSSGGARLASLGWDDDVRVWDLVEGRSITSFSVRDTPDKGLEACWIVHFSLEAAQVILAHEEYPPKLFDSSSGHRIEVDEPPILNALEPTQIPFEVANGKLLRTDVSPPTTVCILPPAYDVLSSAISSFKLDGALGDRVAIGFYDGRLLVLDIAA